MGLIDEESVLADILSTPLGATVKVDGAVVGRTPLVDFKLKPGPHQVEVSKDGYDTWSQTTTAAGKKLFVDANLRPVARATPPPTPGPEAVDVNRVYAENEVDTPPKKLSGMSASYPSGRAPRLKAGDSVSVTLNYVVSEGGQIGWHTGRVDFGARHLDHDRRGRRSLALFSHEEAAVTCVLPPWLGRGRAGDLTLRAL